MIKYITHRPLWFNILVAIALILIFFLIFMLSLNWITKHGEAKTVPSVTGKHISEVQLLLKDKGFETVIQDSVYYDSLPPGIVVKQVPESDQVVKVNRTVYVVINRFVAPDVSMPNLIGFSFRNAEMTLHSQGLRLGDTTYRADFAKNSVLEMIHQGNPVKAGDKIKVGSTIDLILAGGLGEEDKAMPRLVGFSLAEARILLEQNGLVLGSSTPIGNVRDMENAFVVRQNPMTKTTDGVQIRIRPGQMVDVWLSVDPPIVDSVRQAPLPQNP